MKFYHNQAYIDSIDQNFQLLSNPILSNASQSKAFIIITMQIINNNEKVVSLNFRRKKISQDVFTNYSSKIKIKNGTTVLDHLIVIQPDYAYTVSSDSTNIVVSCSYGM